MDKIRQLPGTRMSPRTLLHQLLESEDELEALVVVAFDKNGELWTSWSQLKGRDLAAAAVILHAEANEALHGEFDAESRRDDNGA